MLSHKTTSRFRGADNLRRGTISVARHRAVISEKLRSRYKILLSQRGGNKSYQLKDRLHAFTMHNEEHRLVVATKKT